LDRDGFEQLLDALARAGMLDIRESTFTADGREIVFRKATLTREGRHAEAGAGLELLIREAPAKRNRARVKGKKSAKPVRERPAAEPADPRALALKKWRLEEARQQGVPAFRIFSDKVLAAIVDAEPFDTSDLLTVPGISSRMATRYGPAILKLMQRDDVPQ
jgi:superfamily II DNA helicase RecQ